MRQSLQLLALAFGVLLLISLSSREVRAADPNAEAIANGLQDFAAFGNTIGEFEELGEALPFTDLTPGSADGLRLSDLFGDTFAPLPGSFVDLAALETALEGLDGNYGGVDVVIGDVTISEDTPTTGQIQVVLPFSATRTVSVPLAFTHDIINLDGGSISIDLAIATTITFRLDTSILSDPSDPSLAFAIVGEPTMAVDMDAAGAIGALTANLGFAEVAVSGTADLDLHVDIDFNDPDDDGLITDDEFTSTALVDLVDVAFVDDGGTDAVDVEFDFDTSLISAATPVECSSGDACLKLLDPDITDGLNSPQFFLGDLEDFRNFTAAEALLAVDRLVDWLSGLQSTGQLDVSLPFVSGTFSDVLEVAGELETAAASLRNNAEENIPTFDDAEELGVQLGAALGIGTITPSFSTSSPGVITYEIDISDSASDSVPLNFGGSLDVLSGIGITAGGTATLEGAYSLDLTFGLDLSPQPTEAGAGIGSCQDEEDNDGDTLIDAADPDCAGLKTIGERAFLDVGTAAGSPELAVRVGLSATSVDADARIGMLEAGINDASFRIGSNEDEDATATAGTCNDGVDNDSDGADVDDDDCAFISVDFTKTGDGRLTIEDLFDTLGGSPPSGGSFAAHLSANLDATVPVEATLGGAPLVGGNILVTAEFDGPLTSAADFVTSIEVDASDLVAGDLLNFSPCSNDADDDGDLAVNDGCPQVGATAESGAQCENATDDDSDGVVNDGCPAVADPETESQALLDQIIALIQALADEFDLLEEANVGSSLSDPLPLLGTSFEDLLSFADSLETLLDDMTAVGEDPATECANNIDDDHDGFVNDGCPTVDGVPEAGSQCANATDDEDNDASSAAQDADGFFNDGCPPVNPSLQALEEQIEGLLEDALDDLVTTDADTTSVDATVDVSLMLDGSDLKFLTDVDVSLGHSSTFNLDLSDLSAQLDGVDIVALDTTGDLSVDVVAHLDLDFGLDLDDYSFFVLGSTGLNITAEADADDIVFDVGIGPLTASIGTDTPVAEIDADAVACDPGNTDDEDEDGVVNDGCPADNDDESDGCGNAFDGDDDGKINDGCAAEGSANAESGGQCDNATDDHATGTKINDGCPAVDDAETECDNDTDDDDDGKVNDGCYPGGFDTSEFADECADDADDDGDGFVNDGCPADGDAEGADEPAVCDNDTNDDSNDDAANSINDGCPAVADKGRAFVGAEFNIDLVGGPMVQVAPGSLDFSGGTGFAGIVQLECEDLVSAGSKDACAILPLYFEDAPMGTPPNHHITMALRDITDLSTIEFDYPDVSELIDAIGDQIIDLLLMNSGLGRFLEILDTLLNGEILGFELPLIGDVLDEESGFIETLKGSSPGLATNLSDALGVTNPLAGLANASDVESAAQTLASSLGETLDGDGGDIAILLDTNGDTIVDETDVVAEVFCDDAPCVSPETGTDCANDTDDDGDGVVNDGCPVAGNSAESGTDCDNSDDDDGPDGDSSDVGEVTAKVNDGCYPGGFDPNAWDVTEVRFRAKLGQSAALIDLSADFNLDGIPGLGLSSEGTVELDAFWSLDIGFGVNKTDGFFLLTNDANGSPETGADCEDNYSDDDADGVPNDGCSELIVGADVSLPDTLDAVLGFLEIKVVNGDPSDTCASVGSGTATPCRPAGDDLDPASSFDPKFIIDLKDPGSSPDGKFTFAEMTGAPSFKDVISYDFSAEADVNLHIETSITGEAALPKLIGDLFIDWRWSLQNKDDADELEADSILDNPCDTPADTNCFSIKIDNLVVDAGTFLSKFLGPALTDAQRFTEPLQPVIDVLNAPIPVLTEMSGKPVTLLTLMEAFGPQDNNLDMIIAIAKTIDFINGIQTPTGNDDLTIPIGSFVLDGARLQKAPLGSDASKAFKPGELSGLSSLMGQFDAKNGDFSNSDVRDSGELKSDIGLSFPFLEEPSQLMLMMFGQDADLILWEPPDLEAGFSYSQRFGPIWSLPPVFIEISGSVTITGHLLIGYDTQGLREVLFEGAGGASLLNGLFLGDLKDGVDVPEFALRGELRLGATISVLIFSAGAFGGVGLTLELDLVDPNADGKLKFQEVADILLATANPFCLFIFSGQFDVFAGVFVEVDLFFWSQRWETILAQIVLLRFSVQCDFNVPPILAHVDGSDNLVLHTGPNSGLRGANSVGANATKEDFQVIQEPNGDLTVRAFGFSETHPKPGGGWSSVIANMSHVVGDPKDDEDVLTLLDGALGGETGAECANALDDDGDGFVNDGCPGNGKIERGDECTNALDDEADGSDGFVNDGCPAQGDLTTVPFTVPAVIIGGMGDDQLTGGNGDDYINGGSQNDLINARGGNDNVEGGPGNDQIGGASGEDYIFGDNATVGAAETGADCDGDDDDGDFVVDDGCFDRNSSEPCDTDLEAVGDGNDTIEAGLGEDIVCGQGGDDVITGGISNAKAVGAPETGAQCGNNVDDDDDDAIDDGCEDAADKLFGGSGTDTMNGGDGDDFIYGEDDPDNINGGKGNDVIYGGDESSLGDTIFGGPGADEIHGGDGDDRIIGGNIIAGEPDVGDTLLAGDGGDDIILGDNAQFTSATDFTLIDPNIGGGDVIDGGSGSDVIRGQKGDDDIFGGTQGDNIQGNAGEDFIFGDNGTINNRATASVTVSEVGGDGVDTMNGNEDADHMYGGGADDVMFGDAGTDYMEGNSGGDTMRGGQQDDEMHGDHANDNSTAGSPGKDTMFGDSGDDDMFGGPDQDNMRGGIGDDYMEGNGDADLMHGDAHQDDMIGGTSSANKEDEEFDFGGLIGVRGDLMFGDASQDVMVGDNGAITRPGGTDVDGTVLRTVTLFDLECDTDGEAGPDLMFGNTGNDDMYGGGESDTMHGNDGDDYMEGNCDGDDMWGDADQDDMIGGTSQGGGGVPDGDDEMYGDDGDIDSSTGGDAADVMTGDNAAIDRPSASPWIDDPDTGDIVREITLYDVELAGGPAVATDTSDGDIMYGEGDHDEMFGQGGNDEMHGGDDFDYMEGNHDDDDMWGDADQDDMIGGGSAADGVVRITDDTRIGDDLLDGDDTMYGDDGDLDSGTGGDDNDVMAGDNALVVRPSPWTADLNTGGVVRELRLFDVELSGGSVGAGTSGGDVMFGEGDDDTMFGQGGDDEMHGNDGDDYMEGNHGADLMWGDAGEDDMVGGGSANDGVIDTDRVGDGLLDMGDVMFGDDGDGDQSAADGDEADVMAGDNARILRDLPQQEEPNTLDWIRHVRLFDVATTGDPAAAGTSGGDMMSGEGDNDIMFGQGGNDTMSGGDAFDYMEGNHDDDTMSGNDGQDDMIGGGSANDGIIDDDRLGDDLLDGDDTMYGEDSASGEGTDPDGDNADVMLGDNGVISRPTASLWIQNTFNEAIRRQVILADVETLAAAQPDAEAGEDEMWGNDSDDIMYGQGDEDEMHGGRGDDYLEGNADSDLMFGGDEEDDMLGGTGPTTSSSQLHELSASDAVTVVPGLTDKSTITRDGVPFGTGATGDLTPTIDNVPLGDEMYGGPGADVMLGDNGVIVRPLDGDVWESLNYVLQADSDGSVAPRHPTGAASARVNRITDMVDTVPGMTAGSDLMFGEQGDDDMYGQYDDTGVSGIGDEMYGAEGEDAMAGDQGVFDSRVLTDPTQNIEPKEPFIDDDIFIQGTLFREFQFPSENQQQQIETGGNDRMRGGENGDWMHGGAGSDVMNGDEGNDRMFGNDGDDAMWGGANHDHVWGGNGFDLLDVHPRVDESDAAPDSCNPLDPPDPSAWYTFAFDSGGTCDGNLEEVDYIYGGWDSDVMQANVGDNGPRIGDRLIDWVGVYNLSILCPATYGEFVTTREFSPAMRDFLHRLAEGDGAFQPGPEGKKLAPSDPSGFNEIAFVYTKDIKFNKNPPHVDTPANFTITPDCQTFP